MTKPSITAYHSLRKSFPSTSFTTLFSNIIPNGQSTRQSIKLPIIQAPMMGSTSLSLVSAVCNTGALGQIPAYKTAPADLQANIAQLRQMTDRPFGVNLGVPRNTITPTNQPAHQSSFSESKHAVEDILSGLGSRHTLSFDPSTLRIDETTPVLPDFHQQLAVLFDSHVPIVSFVFGIPDDGVIAECKKRNILTIGTATSVPEVAALRAVGVDAIVVQGSEAGGHRGGWMHPDHEIAEKRLIGLLPLLSSIRKLDVAGSTPLIAAGGIADAASMVSAFMHGASAVQIGTAFLTCDESTSAVPTAWRDLLLAPSRSVDHSIKDAENHVDIAALEQVLRPTVVTRGFTSRPARGFTNDLTDAMKHIESKMLPWPQHNAVVSQLVSLATKRTKPELMQMWAGQAYSLCGSKSAAELIDELVTDAQAIMNP